MADGGVPGVEDVARLGGWLADSGIPAGDGPPAVQLIGGGRSNLTYRLDVGPSRAPLSCAARRSATCCRPRTT
jgi:hypothetical protein